MRWVTLGAAVLLGACSTIVPRGPVAAPDRPVAAPVAAPRDDGIDRGIPRDAERNRVALLVPLSGSNAGIGRSIANATMLAVLDTRTEKVRITNYDTATGASAAARRAIAEGAQLILGPLLSEDVRAVAPIAKAANVPVISFSNDVGVAGDGTYLLGYAPTQSIERVVGYAKTRGVTSFAGSGSQWALRATLFHRVPARGRGFRRPRWYRSRPIRAARGRFPRPSRG